MHTAHSRKTRDWGPGGGAKPGKPAFLHLWFVLSIFATARAGRSLCPISYLWWRLFILDSKSFFLKIGRYQLLKSYFLTVQFLLIAIDVSLCLELKRWDLSQEMSWTWWKPGIHLVQIKQLKKLPLLSKTNSLQFQTYVVLTICGYSALRCKSIYFFPVCKLPKITLGNCTETKV